jgi:DNA-binding Lrp family transcriptional regulator
LTDEEDVISNEDEVQQLIELEKIVDDMLSDPHLIEKVKELLDCIVVGEDEEKLANFILCLSGKAKDPKMKQIMLFKGEPGAGKSRLAKISKLFRCKEVGRFSEHALDYSDLENYEILWLKEIGDLDQEKQGVSTLKFVSTEDEGYNVEVTVRDKETGKFKTEQYKIPPITLVTTTTRVVLDHQFERRAWIFNPDDSPEQTERIKKFKAKLEKEAAEVSLGLRKETSHDYAWKVLSRLVQKLKLVDVIIPFSESLGEILESHSLRVRGDYDKVVAFIKLHAILYQKQLPMIEVNGRKVIISTPWQALEALKLVKKPLMTMLMNLEERTRRLIEAMEKEGYTDEGTVIGKKEREQIAKRLGLSEKTVRVYLNEWEDSGYLSSDEKKPKSHTLLYPLETIKKKEAGLSSKFENSNELIPKMVKEATEWLKPLLEKISLPDIEIAKIMDAISWKPIENFFHKYHEKFVENALKNGIKKSDILDFLEKHKV